MMRSATARKAPLDDLAEGLLCVRSAEIQRRNSVRRKARMGALIRQAMADAGIDPAAAKRLRDCDEAAAALEAFGDTPELEQADAAFCMAHPSSYNQLPDELLAARRAEILAKPPMHLIKYPPNPTWFSIDDWFAWACLRHHQADAEP